MHDRLLEDEQIRILVGAQDMASGKMILLTWA